MANTGHQTGRPQKSFESYLLDRQPNGCVEWGGARARGGYGQYKVGGKMRYAHRLAYEAANGPIPKGMFVCHSCDNPACCNVEHLFLGTASDNMQDKLQKGRNANFTGALNPAAKLTPHIVRQIRKLCAEGMKQRQVAELFGVTQANVSLIVTRKKWGHIP